MRSHRRSTFADMAAQPWTHPALVLTTPAHTSSSDRSPCSAAEPQLPGARLRRSGALAEVGRIALLALALPHILRRPNGRRGAETAVVGRVRRPADAPRRLGPQRVGAAP